MRFAYRAYAGLRGPTGVCGVPLVTLLLRRDAPLGVLRGPWEIRMWYPASCDAGASPAMGVTPVPRRHRGNCLMRFVPASQELPDALRSCFAGIARCASLIGPTRACAGLRGSSGVCGVGRGVQPGYRDTRSAGQAALRRIRQSPPEGAAGAAPRPGGKGRPLCGRIARPPAGCRRQVFQEKSVDWVHCCAAPLRLAERVAGDIDIGHFREFVRPGG